MNGPAAAFAAILLLTSCGAGAAINPTVGQLDDTKTLARAGDDLTVARTPISCQPSAAGCAQLHALRAGACRRIAAHDCAVAEYQTALAAARIAPDPNADPVRLELALLESAHARRDATRGAAADSANKQLLAAAVSAQPASATRTAGYFYAANATLFSALQTAPPAGCEAIGRAGQDLARARTEGTPFQSNGRVLGQAIANSRAARGCPT